MFVLSAVIIGVAVTGALQAIPAQAKLVCESIRVTRPDGQVAIIKRCHEISEDDSSGSISELPVVDAPAVLLAEAPPPTPRFPACNRAAPSLSVHGCGSFTIPRPATPDPATGTDPAAIARRAAAELLTRPGTVGILPATTITGLPTYYWLDGVTPRQTTRSQAGITITIHAAPTNYTWDFGDHTTQTGSPGRNGPPGASEIQHTYTRSAHYQVNATVTWAVTFTVNGLTEQLPGAFTTTATSPLRVDQLRTRLTG